MDGTKNHAWIVEPPTSKSNTASLTDAGVESIAAHQYKPGHYTYMDAKLNPIWTALTELLPISLAPNMVTFIGALHCGLAYGLTWFYSPNFDTPLPDWVVFLSGYCTIAYYTFDCMDGKQARRTGQSSPLGQLFDHGFDCICNLAHVSTQAGYLLVGGSGWFFGLQGSVFFAFFMAQWEEYYTGELPHAMGNFGVTEVNYGMGIFAIVNSFLDRERVWTAAVGDLIPHQVLEVVTGLPDWVLDMQLKHFGLYGWMATSCVLIMGSFYRVLTHENVTGNGNGNGLRFAAIAKLITPLFIALAPFWLPTDIMENETRYISVCNGLLMSFLTKKMICFSMAKQTFASIQIEAIPYWAVFLWIRYDENITERGATVLLGGLCVWYAYRLLSWASGAIDQICARLDIHCFTIKQKKMDDVF
jgi:phosphatidylglycerophosphate synthase